MNLKLTKNIKALSKLSLILLLIISLIIGALLSYFWAVGYYLTLGIKVPEDTTLSISNIAFTNQSTSHFNVTFLNPSYSPSAAKITGIATKTADNELHNVTQTSPELPYSIPKAQNITFKCIWNWANYTGQNIEVITFIEDGSGPTRKAATPFVGLTIREAYFDSSISFTYFNLTIRSSLYSATSVNISRIIVSTEILQKNQTSPPLPYELKINETRNFKCIWDWTGYQNKSITITVQTVQGYIAYYTKTTPRPLDFEITDITFSESDMANFNITVRNGIESPTFIDINKIAATLENGTKKEINGTKTTPALPYKLNRNSIKTFKCPFDWTRYRGKNVKISVFTAQNYTIQYTKATPSPITITDAIFSATDTNNFNITVYNSALYHTSVNITSITLTLENGTVKEINGTKVLPKLPHILGKGLSITFKCPWNWTGYQARNVTVTVRTEENYRAQYVKVTPKRVILTIASIGFDSINTGIFEVTVRSSALSLENANITRVTVTFENGTVKEISNTTPSLAYLLNPNSIVKFTCQLDWTNYRGKNITITVYAAKGYWAFSLYTTPPL
jgi:hypothetical protein